METKEKKDLANFLLELIKEDRIEQREIKKKIDRIITTFVIATFSICAYLLKIYHKEFELEIIIFCLITCVSFSIFSWIYFFRLRKDLFFLRNFLEQREVSLEKICDDKDDKSLFPSLSTDYPKMKFKEIKRPIIIATIIYSGLILCILCLYIFHLCI